MKLLDNLKKRCVSGRELVAYASYGWKQPIMRAGIALLTVGVALSLSGCDGGGNPPPAGTGGVAVVRSLNDTGTTTWGNATVNDHTATQSSFPRQDADIGRDARAVAGTLVKTGGGKAGFDFTKLDAAGKPLANQAATYTSVTPWSCVQDNVTGLMWEVQTIAGSGGLRDANHTYTWFNATGVNDGGNAGTPNGGICVDGLNCDTEKYVAAVNAVGLCGFKDWRLPKREALRSIVDLSLSSFGNSIDVGYFPNTVSTEYWSASPYAVDATHAWSIGFGLGNDGVGLKTSSYDVRLVRGRE